MAEDVKEAETKLTPQLIDVDFLTGTLVTSVGDLSLDDPGDVSEVGAGVSKTMSRIKEDLLSEDSAFPEITLLQVNGYNFRVFGSYFYFHSLCLTEGSIRLEFSSRFACMVFLAGAVSAFPSFEDAAVTLMARSKQIAEQGLVETYKTAVNDKRIRQGMAGTISTTSREEYLRTFAPEEVRQGIEPNQLDLDLHFRNDDNLAFPMSVQREVKKRFFDIEGNILRE